MTVTAFMVHYFIIIIVCIHVHRKPLDKLKSTNVICDEGGTRDVYEEPDQMKIRVTTTAQPKNFELTKCPAYVSTRNNALKSANSDQ